MAVVFDGSDVIGAHSARRRLVRVRYSPAGVTADDVIRAEVGAANTSRAVVVVTNDGAVRRDVAAAGANTVSSDAFLDVALRQHRQESALQELGIFRVAPQRSAVIGGGSASVALVASMARGKIAPGARQTR